MIGKRTNKPLRTGLEEASCPNCGNMLEYCETIEQPEDDMVKTVWSCNTYDDLCTVTIINIFCSTVN